jgi:lantibiotic transport system ATP-binding protein
MAADAYCIETHGLSRKFGSTVAVQSLDLNVPERSVFGFLGPNGAGKTTTIRMLLGLVRPDAGSVRLFGQPFTRRDWRLLGQVGALVESPSLYPHLSGRENLEVTRRLTDAARGRIDAVLDVTQLSAVADRCVRTYSTGMRQRLGVALALLGEPRLVILDEPTNGLDPAGIIEMRSFLRRLPEESGATVFLSSHLLAEVELVCSHIGIIDRGQLLFQGTLEVLRQQVPSLLGIGCTRQDAAQQALVEGGWQPRCANDEIEVLVSTRAEAAAINHLLARAGLDVYELHLRRPTLEDIFLRLTRAH